MPNFRDYEVEVGKPGTENAETTRILGHLLRDVMRLNASAHNFRVFGPHETASSGCAL
jgi:xylulose-5-phosphate/fructose-6-phosphate phosphoketolase